METRQLFRHWITVQGVAFITALMAMSLLRWLFYIVNRGSSFGNAPADLVQTAFLNGIRFDAAVLGLLTVIAFVVSLPLGFIRPRIAKGLWIAVFSTGIIYIVAVSFGDIFYSQYAGKRLSYEVTVFFTSQALPLLATAAHDFPLLFPTASLVLAAILFVGVRLYKRLPEELFAHKFSIKTTALVCSS